MSNIIAPRKLFPELKEDIDKKFEDDYKKVKSVIRKMSDKKEAKNLTLKLLEAYINKTNDLGDAMLKLKKLFDDRNLIDVFIPGFNSGSRKYLFKNPDPLGYRLMSQNEELMPIADFVWYMMDSADYNSSVFNKDKILKRGLLGESLKYWQITGYLINMFAFKENIDLTVFFNFDKNLRELKNIGRRLDIPFKERAVSTGEKNRRKGQRGKKGQRDRQRGGQDNGEDERKDYQKNRGNQSRRKFDRNDRRNNRRDNRRDRKNHTSTFGGFDENSLIIFKKIRKQSSIDKNMQVNMRDELNEQIKFFVNTMKPKLVSEKKYKEYVYQYQNNVNKDIFYLKGDSGCSLKGFEGLTKDVQKFRDIFNDKLYYDKEDARKYFFSLTGRDVSQALKNFENQLTNQIFRYYTGPGQQRQREITVKLPNNDEDDNENESNDLLGGKKPRNKKNNSFGRKSFDEQKEEIKSKLSNIQIQPLYLNNKPCFISDIINLDLLDKITGSENEQKDKLREFVLVKLKREILPAIKNLVFNLTSVENMFDVYKFESINFIETMSKENLKDMLMGICIFLMRFYGYCVETYTKYINRIQEDFSLERKDIEQILKKRGKNINIGVNQINNRNNKTDKNQNNGLNTKYQRKQRALNKITNLLTKYKNDPEKRNKLKGLLNKARAMEE